MTQVLGIQRILKDSTDALVVVPPWELVEKHGAPTSATVRAQTPSTALPDSGDAMTVDPVSATTNAAADAGALTLSFASDPSVTRGWRYLLEDANGSRLQVAATGSGATIGLADELEEDVATAATLSGLTLTHALTAAETAELGPGIAKVTATMADGEVVEWDHPILFVAELFSTPLDPVELRKLEPSVYRQRPAKGYSLADAIDAAFYGEVEPRLAAVGVELSAINAPRALNPCIAAFVAAKLFELANPTEGETIERLFLRAEGKYELAIRSRHLWVDAAFGETDGVPAGGDGRTQNVLLQTGRLIR